jgi:hypothetical protein
LKNKIQKENASHNTRKSYHVIIMCAMHARISAHVQHTSTPLTPLLQA